MKTFNQIKKPEEKLLVAIFGQLPVGKKANLYRREVNGVTLKEAVKVALSTLPPREAAIIRMRFRFYDPFGRGWTLKDIGEIFGVTSERIRQLEAKGLRRLRHPRNSRLLSSYFLR